VGRGVVHTGVGGIGKSRLESGGLTGPYPHGNSVWTLESRVCGIGSNLGVGFL
jgi:hypothetical protein